MTSQPARSSADEEGACSLGTNARKYVVSTDLSDVGVISVREQYTTQGYVVLRNVLDDKLLDRVIRLYRRDIATSNRRFFRQNTIRYQANKFNDSGYVIDSFLDIHSYKSYPDFRRAALEVFLDPRLLKCLQEANGFPTHNLMQTMLFDANTATWPHQDCWYADSVPAGHLIGAWIALEDIHEDAGRFFVVPRSHVLRFHNQYKQMPLKQWLTNIQAFVDAEDTKIHAPALNKGDLILWNSNTVHGSLKTANHIYSRKSLTGHYLPSTMSYGHLFAEKPWTAYDEYNGHKVHTNVPEFSWRNFLLAELKCRLVSRPMLMSFARRFQRSSYY